MRLFRKPILAAAVLLLLGPAAYAWTHGKSGGASGTAASFMGTTINVLGTYYTHPTDANDTSLTTPYPTAVGIGTLRFWEQGITWYDLTAAYTNPVSPGGKRVYTWTILDRMIATAVANGDRMIWTLGFTPPWSQASPSITLPPDNLGVTGTVATNAVTTASTVLHFAAVPAGIATGANVTDLTSPAAIPAISLVWGSISGTTLTVTRFISGPPLAVGRAFKCLGCTASTITGLGTGAGGTGTYTVGSSQSVVATSITFGAATTVVSQTSTSVTISGSVTVASGDSIRFTDDVADFAGDLANHVAGITGAAALFDYEGVNEPNAGCCSSEFWNGTMPQLLGMQQSFYNAIKAVNSSAVVRSPAFNNGMVADPFLTFFGYTPGQIGTGQTAAQVSDGTDLHIYTVGPPNEPPENVTFDYSFASGFAYLNAHGMSGKSIVITESGWGQQQWIYNTGFDKVAYVSRLYLYLLSLQNISIVCFYAYDGHVESSAWGGLWIGPGNYVMVDYHIQAGGTGYSAGLVNLPFTGTLANARIAVNSIASGVVTENISNVIDNGGVYTAPLTNPIATSGNGAGNLTVNGTWQQANSDGLLPEGVAYGQVYKWIVGATLGTVTCPTAGGGSCAGGAGVTWSMAFTRPAGYKALAVWNSDGSSSTFTVPGGQGYSQYHDLAGVLHTGLGATVTITGKPILIENGSAF